jgi:hypothetical protein
MRIGELLVGQRKLRPEDLTRALADKPADTRLVSYLIAKGLVDFDDASRALGVQKHVACALAKHLAGRDPALATLIPADLGRKSCALPIGRSSKGSVIVCVRDPSPALRHALEQAIRGDILIVIAPASRLEQLVAQTYGSPAADEVDFDIAIDLEPETQIPRRPLTTPPMPGAAIEPPTFRPYTYPRAVTPPPMPPMPDMDVLDPESIRLSLTDLDDVRVTKDPAQSGQIPIIGSTLPPSGTSLTALAAGTVLPQKTTGNFAAVAGLATNRTTGPLSATAVATVQADAPVQPTLESLQRSLEGAETREAATDAALAYVATRWHSGLVLGLRDRAAIGYRGHRVVAPESVTVSLGSPSTVQRAVHTRFVSVEAPTGVGQSALTHALGGSRTPAAAPIMVGGQPIAVIAVGDPLDGPGARDLAAADLAKLAEALGTAYTRIMAR